MGSSVPLRTDFDATRLRGFARKCGDNRQIRRLLSLAAVYDGMTRTEAAKVGGMDRQTCLLYTSPSPRDVEESRMPSSA